MSEITITEDVWMGVDVIIFEHNEAESWKLFKQAAKWLKETGATPLVASFENSWDDGYRESLHVTVERI